MRGYRADIAFDGERALPGGALVLVEDGVIVAVEPASAAAPDGCPVTHLPGTALLPGLIDTHVHLCADSSPARARPLPEKSPDRAATRSSRRHSRVTCAPASPPSATSVTTTGRSWTSASPPTPPPIVAAGPPLTTPKGHCWSMGGETDGVDDAAPRRPRAGRARRRRRQGHGQRRGDDPGHRRPGLPVHRSTSSASSSTRRTGSACR